MHNQKKYNAMFQLECVPGIAIFSANIGTHALENLTKHIAMKQETSTSTIK